MSDMCNEHGDRLAALEKTSDTHTGAVGELKGLVKFSIRMQFLIVTLIVAFASAGFKILYSLSKSHAVLAWMK